MPISSRVRQTVLPKPKEVSFCTVLRQNSIHAALLQMKRLERPNGRMPRGSMQNILKDLKKNGVEVTRDFLYYRKRDFDALKPRIDIIDVPVKQSADDLSTLSKSNNTPPAVVIVPVEQPKRRGRGRPKGTTLKAKAEQKKARASCINDIVKCFIDELKSVRENPETQRAANGFLTNLIITKWTEHGLFQCEYNKNLVVCSDTIRNRAYNSIDKCCSQRGVKSPLSRIEESFCDILIEMGKIRQPLSVQESVELVNSLIKGSDIEDELIAFKKRRYKNLPLEECKKVGKGWWSGFLRRNGHRIVTKRGQKFESNRADWCKEVYIRQMYDVIYDNMVEAGIAEKLAQPVFMDANGDVVDKDDPNRLGLECDIKITHPDYLLFADETGCNTSQRKDGHYGGRKYVTERGTTPKTIAANTDKHFTVLGFTAANGDPVLCVIIFASEKELISGNWATGIDPTVSPILDEDGEIMLTEDNFGEGKFYPSGPTCLFRGKRVPYLPLVSPSGGITSDLLVEILEHMDELQIFERKPGGPTPMIILDGHESRLGLPFLHYINNEDHKWFVSLGVPYATSYWQVGDSAEQNGMFKMLLGEAKRQLISFRSDHGLSITIRNEDIVPLVNKAWNDSFGRKVTNKKAIAERGWFPANRNVLLHKDIKKTVQVEEKAPLNLNTTEGMSGIAMSKILQAHARNGGVERHQKALKDGKKLSEIIDKGKRMTSGIMVGHGSHSCNERSVYTSMVNKKSKDDKTIEKAKKKDRKEKLIRKKAVQELRSKKPRIDTWNNKECSLFIQYKKKRGDPAKPKSILDLRSRCHEIHRQPSPICSPHASDDEDDDVLMSDVEGAGVIDNVTCDFVNVRTFESHDEEKKMNNEDVDVMMTVQI
jgi:hypothetical protein